MISKGKEMRSDVRTGLSYIVKYEIISPEEYGIIREKPELTPNLGGKKLKIVPALTDNNSKRDFVFNIDDCNNALVEFLVKMDQKLDKILSMLSANKVRSESSDPRLLNDGRGNNISASGISIFTSKPANKGQIVHMNITLCELPPVSIEAYGEIVRVTIPYENNTPMYELGIKFVTLNEKDKEKIVAYVFSKQRKALRSGKIQTNQYLMDS